MELRSGGHVYSAFGLEWDIPWPFTRFPTAQGQQADPARQRVTVTLSEPFTPPPSVIRRTGPLRFLDDSERMWLRVPGAGVFRIDRNLVEFAPATRCDEGLRDLALAGPVAGVVLRHFGLTPVHGAAVAWRSQAALLIGPAAIGTSSLAAALAVRGFTLVGDDLLALQRVDDGTLLWGGGRYLQLPSDVVDAFGERLAGAVAPSRPAGDISRRDVQIPTPTRAYPLAAIYVIDADAAERPEVGPLTGLTRIESVLTADWHLPARRKAGCYSDDFVQAARLTGPVSMRRVSRLDANSLHVGALSKVVAADIRRLVNAESDRAR